MNFSKETVPCADHRNGLGTGHSDRDRCSELSLCSIRDGVTVRYIDALYMSTSAVCVTDW